jgi:outer membrane protein insertion porin family
VDVIFDGAQAFPQKKLRKELKTRRWWMWSWITQSGKIKDEVFEDDKDRLADFYRNAGYIDFELKEVKQELLKPTRMILHFVVSEGRQYKVGAIGFKGIALFPTNNVAAVLKMKVGDTFTPKGLATDKEAIEDFYGSRGYIGSGGRGSVFVFPRKNPNVETGTMDLVYEIEEGEESKIEKIEIKGNVRTKDKVIRRELLVSPGERFDMVRVKKSKGASNRWVSSNVSMRIPKKRKSRIARISPSAWMRRTRAISPSARASVQSIRSSASLISLKETLICSSRHIHGGGQKFRLHAAVGTERQDYLVSFVEPWFLDQKLALGVDLYFREAGYYSDLFDERRGGGASV